MLIARKMTDKKAHTHIRTRKCIVIFSHTSLTVVCSCQPQDSLQMPLTLAPHAEGAREFKAVAPIPAALATAAARKVSSPPVASAGNRRSCNESAIGRSTRGTGPRHLAQTLAAALVEFSFGSAWLTRQPLGDPISSTCVWAKL